MMNIQLQSVYLVLMAMGGCSTWKAQDIVLRGDTGSVDDFDGDGWPADSDCDDTDASIHPEASERCNGVDDDCNGTVDDGLGQDWFVDADEDAYGAEFLTHACQAPDGAVAADGDCVDSDPNIHPYSTALVDGQDSNCDGRKDWLVNVAVAVDDQGEICIDDRVLGNTGATWRTGTTYEVWLETGTHTVGIHGWDTGMVITAAIAHLEISDGTVWVTDGTWRYDPDPDQYGAGKVGWCTTGFDDSEWGLALDVGPIGDPSHPWGNAPSVFPEGSPAHWIWDHFPVELNSQYLRMEFELP